MAAFTRQDWNDIIGQINSLATSPPSGCDPLPAMTEVPEKHRWSKTDIAAAQTLLTQICGDNTFSPMPSLWKKSIVDELNAAIARGWCNCCEPEDRVHPRLNTFAPSGYKLFFSSSTGSNIQTFDWAGWMFQQIIAPFDEEISLAVGGPLLVPSGGPGWVGREWSRWEMLIARTGDTPALIARGAVADGYLVLGDAASEAAWVVRGQALDDERQAIVAKAQAEADYAADPNDTTQQALTDAENDLTMKTAVRFAADSDAVNNPQARHFPWLVEFAFSGHWRLTGHEFVQILPTSAFRQAGQPLVNEADAPYILQAHPVGTATGVLRLFC